MFAPLRNGVPEGVAAISARTKSTVERFHVLLRRKAVMRSGTGLFLVSAAITLPLLLAGTSKQPARVVMIPNSAPTSQTTEGALSTNQTTTSRPPTPASAPANKGTSQTVLSHEAQGTAVIPATSTTVPPPCSTQQYTARATTDQSSYARGRSVIITVTMTNSGPTCEGTPPWWCGQEASAYDSSGTDVWDLGAGPTTPQGVRNCPAALEQTVAHGSSSAERLSWQQDQCTFDPSAQPIGPNPDCPGTQVPDGTYKVVGDAGMAPPVTVTISS